MHEAYLEQGLIVKDAKKLRIHYAKNRSCLKTKNPYLDNQCHTIKMYMKTWSVLNQKTSFQRRLTFVLDMISVLPTDLFFFYTGVACHEQVDHWCFLFSSSKRELKDFVIKSAHLSRFKIFILILRFPVLWS